MIHLLRRAALLLSSSAILLGILTAVTVHDPADAVSVRDSVVRSQLRRSNRTLDDQLEELHDTGLTLDVILDTLGREEPVRQAYRRIGQAISSVPLHRQGAGWGRLVPDPGTPPPHPAIRRYEAFEQDAGLLNLPVTDIPRPQAEDLQDHESALDWSRSAFFLLPAGSSLPPHTAGTAMAEWRNAFARQSALEAWATSAAALHAADDAAEMRRVLTEQLSLSASLREDLHIQSQIAIQNLLATSATTRILAAQLEAEAAAYLAAGPVFVAGESLVKPQFLPSGTVLP